MHYLGLTRCGRGFARHSIYLYQDPPAVVAVSGGVGHYFLGVAAVSPIGRYVCGYSGASMVGWVYRTISV